MVQKFWFVILLWFILRCALLTLAWTGDTAPESREKVLKFFNSEDIERGHEYLLNGFGVRVFFPLVKLSILLILVFGGFPGRIGDAVNQWTRGGFWLPSFFFLVIFFFIMQLIALPFDYYGSYICEKRMGFTSMTSSEWFWRHLKGIMVSWPIQATAILLALWAVKTFDRFWPLVVPIIITAIGVILTLLAPDLVTPLFYNQKPLSDGPLKVKIQEIAEKAGIPVEGIYEIDESRYSKHTNAYFTGLFSKKRIVLYDTLIKSHTVDEAALIFAHEVGHWKHDHVLIGTFLGFLGGLAGCIAAWFLFPLLRAEPAFGLREIHSVVNIPFFLIVSMILGLFTAPIESQISQYFERQADRASLELTGLAKTFIEAEIRLARDNRGELLPHPIRVIWLYSHPPAIDRIGMAIDYQDAKP